MITVYNKNNAVKVSILGEIGNSFWSEGMDFNKFKNIVGDTEPSEIEVEIKSPGGMLLEAFAIYDYLRNIDARVTTRMVGATASAGTIIAMAGDQREITENSNFFIHRSQTVLPGNSEELKKASEELEKFDDQLARIYQKATGKRKKELYDLMADEKWLTAKEAEAWGFAKVKKEKKEVLNQIDIKMDTKRIMKLLNVKDEEQIESALEIRLQRQKDLENEIENYQEAENQRKQKEVDDFINEQKGKVKEEMIPHLTNIAKNDLDTAKVIAKGLVPEKLSNRVEAEPPKREEVEKAEAELTDEEKTKLINKYNQLSANSTLMEFAAKNKEEYARMHLARFGRKIS